jgi:hypothetical protein
MYGSLYVGPTPSLPGTDWLQNVETLKESLRLAGSGSIDLNSVDMAQFQGSFLIEDLLCRMSL